MNNNESRAGVNRVLHILSNLANGGGVQTLLRDLYPEMIEAGYCFDFVVHGSDVGEMESWFEESGSKIYHIIPRSKNPIKNILQLNRIIKENRYSIIHCHQDYHSAVAVVLAKLHGVKRIVVNSHLAYPPESLLKKICRRIESAIVKVFSSDYVAVSNLAGEWLFGKKAMAGGKVELLRICIDDEKFRYSEEIRNNVRLELDVGEKILLGNVARFTTQKNHNLLLRIFKAFNDKHPESVLVLAGDGPLFSNVKKQAADLGIMGNVAFLGTRSDVNRLMQAMDVFVFSSRHEGFGIVAVEAQAVGLPVVASEYVPKDIAVTDRVKFLPVKEYENINQWVTCIEQMLSMERTTEVCVKMNSDIANIHNSHAAANTLKRVYERQK